MAITTKWEQVSSKQFYLHGGYENRTRLSGWEATISSPETAPISETVKILNFRVGSPQ